MGVNRTGTPLTTIVEKYSPLDFESYKTLASTEEVERVELQIRRTINALYDIHRYDNDELIIIGLILTHLSIFMFAFRHLRKSVLGKTFISALVLIVAISFASAITGADFYDPFYYFRTHNSPEEIFFVFFLAVISLGILYLALRVFWQKKYRTSTAISITLLPYMVYYWLLVITAEYIWDAEIVKYYYELLHQKFSETLANTATMLLLGTPFAILAVFILVKAMYTRLLVLPEG